MTRRFSSFDEGLKAYEAGKSWRYELLFAVNGGAFAIAKLFSDSKSNACGYFVGYLKLEWVAYGMVAFTMLVCWDIFNFGLSMRELIEEPKIDLRYGVFSLVGRMVLIFLGALISLGWAIVGVGCHSYA